MQQPHGIIVMDKGIYNWKSNKLTVEELSFTTEENKGISYHFSGRLFIGGIYEDLKPSEAVIQGKLKKLANSEVVAEEKVDLLWRSWSAVDRDSFELKKKSP